MKGLIYFLGFLFISTCLSAQDRQVYQAYVDNNDTIVLVKLPEVWVLSEKKFKNKAAKRKYNRTIRYVKKVYPYAKLAGQKLRLYDDTLRKITSDKQRKKFMKKIEKELKAEYEGELKKLTFTQGKILLKLIDRETNHTSYALLQELRGNVSAVLWQGVGRLFGYNLKMRYEPDGRDKEIERIVLLIEAGAL